MGLLQSFFGNPQSSTARQLTTPLDLVTYAGDLASNPEDIDPLLDEVRKITSLRSMADGLSPADEATLFKVYLQIEDYLTTRDPIRTYTKSELRSRLQDELQQKLTTYETEGAI